MTATPSQIDAYIKGLVAGIKRQWGEEPRSSMKNIEEITTALIADGWSRRDSSNARDQDIALFRKEHDGYVLRIYMAADKVGAGLYRDVGEVVMATQFGVAFPVKTHDRLYDVFVTVPEVTLDDVRGVLDLLLKNSRKAADMIEKFLHTKTESPR